MNMTEGDVKLNLRTRLVPLSLASLLLFLVYAIYLAMQTGEKSPIIAAGNAKFSMAAGGSFEAIFISVHDEESKMPMPYGAVRYSVPGDLSSGLDFVLTRDNLRVMNPDAPPPQKLRIKVRLDRDGLGGADSPGDIVGEVTGVNFGTEGLEISVSRPIEEQ